MGAEARGEMCSLNRTLSLSVFPREPAASLDTTMDYVKVRTHKPAFYVFKRPRQNWKLYRDMDHKHSVHVFTVFTGNTGLLLEGQRTHTVLYEADPRSTEMSPDCFVLITG